MRRISSDDLELSPNQQITDVFNTDAVVAHIHETQQIHQWNATYMVTAIIKVTENDEKSNVI
jgi:hypothetical protein